MPRLRQSVLLLRSALAAYRRDHSSVERCLRTSKTLERKISSLSGEPCRKLLRLSTLRAHSLGWLLEERIENRAVWESYAERPRCHFSVSPGSGVDPSPKTEDIIGHTHEISDLDTDKQCIHPGLQIEEEITIQHEVETFEQPRLPLADLGRSEERGKDQQDVVDAVEPRQLEQEIEESYWSETKIQPAPFEAGQVEASVGSNVDVEKNGDRIVERLQDEGLGGDNGEVASLDYHRDRKYLHVLSVAEVREVLEKARAKDLKVLYVKDFCEWTDYIVLASGRSTRHLRGMADAIVYKVKQRSHNVGPNLYPLVEGREAEQWMTVDLGNITIHVFLEEARSYYNLEELWRKKKSRSFES